MIGESLGAYRIVDQIGQGGMATVYKAYHAAMDRYVAVKVLPAHFAQDPTFTKRFQREARLIAKLEHAHILPVYDFGEQDGVTYLVMRYLDTGTLRDSISNGPLPLNQAASLLRQTGGALDYAHENKVIHRDIKPSNVLVDSQGNAFISDFGISKIVGGDSGELTDLTGGGQIGTPAYMAPEQGLGQPASSLTDQYALAVVLYEMVTGQVPYRAETPVAVLMMHLNSPLPMPSRARPGLPEDVERVILKALAKDPADRFPNCVALADAFERAVGGLPIHIVERAEAIEEMVAPTPRAAITPPVISDADTVAMTQAALPTRAAGRRRVPVWVWPLAALLVVAMGAGLFFGLRGEQPFSLLSGGGEVIERSAGPPVSPGEPPAVLRFVDDCLEDQSPASGVCIYGWSDGKLGSLYTKLLPYSTLDIVGGPFSWSPDGQHVVFAALEAGEDPTRDTSLYIIDSDGSDLRELPNEGRNNIGPAWSPDGQWIVFHSSGDLAVMQSDGSDFEVIYSEAPEGCAMAMQWAPDSYRFVATVTTPGCTASFPFDRAIWVKSRDGNEAILVAEVHHEGPEMCPEIGFSPDGTQVFYMDETCQPRIVNADGSGGDKPLTAAPYWWTGPYYPQWGRGD